MPVNPRLLFGFLLFTLLQLWTISAWGSHAVFNFDNLSTQQGLGNPWVLAILHDKQGFVWVGTHDGLYRYDGYHLKTFKHDPKNDGSLAQNIVYTLFEDSARRLWVGTQGGVLHKYDAQTETFVRYPFDKNYPNTTVSNSRITSIAQGQNRDLWIATFGGGISRFDLRTQQFSHNYRHDPDDAHSLSDDQANAVLVDQSNNLWVATNHGGLNLFDRNTGKFKRFQHDPLNPNSLSHNNVNALFEDIDGHLWIGTLGGGLNHFDPVSGAFEHYRHDPAKADSLASDEVQTIFEDKSGSLWLGIKNGGLNRFNQSRDRFDRYRHDPKDNLSLADDDVFAIAEDQNGFLWLGTFGGGISKFDPSSERFGLVKHNPSNPNSLIKGDVDAIYQDKNGIIWVGTQSGLNRYEHDNDDFTHYRHDPNNPNSISDSHVRSIFEDAKGTLWVGTQTGGLNRLNQQDGSFTNYRYSANDPHSLSDDYVKTIHVDSQDNLWIGTINGLDLYDPKADHFIRYHHADDNDKSISSNNIYYMLNAKDGSLWISTLDGGVNRFDHQTQTFTHYQHDPANDNSLSHNTVYSMAQDSRGVFWFGTAGGLNRFDAVNHQFAHYREENGLSSDIVYAVLTDKQGNIWLGGSDISLFQPTTAHIKNSIGAEANCSTYDGAFFKARDGKLFFGSQHGFCAFYPEKATRQSHPPLIAFTDFRLLNKSVPLSTKDSRTPLSEVINYTRALTLTHKDNVLSFEFAALHYANPKLNQYRYKLEGFNQDWIETGADNRRATYTNLPAGDYRFRVRASNSKGLWNEEGRTLSLTILPAPWHTWWAYTLYSLIFTFFVYSYARAQRKKIQLERDISRNLEQKVAERTADLRKSNQSISALSDICTQIGSTLDLNKLMHTVYDQIKELMNTDSFGIGIYQREKQKIVFKLVIESGVQLPRFSVDINQKNQPAVWCIEQQKPLFSNDIEQDFADFFGRLCRPEPMAGKATHSLIYWPLQVGGQIIGVLTVQSFDKNAYNAHHQDIIQTLASTTAIALDNANVYLEVEEANLNLEQKVAERTKELELTNQSITILSEISSEVSSTLDLDEILDTLYDHIHSLMDVDVFVIGLYEGDKEHMVIKLATGCGEPLEEHRVEISDKTLPPVWRKRYQQSTVINDYKQDLSDLFGEAALPGLQMCRTVESMLYWPLSVGGQLIGFLTMQSYHKNAYNQHKQDMINTLASTTAIALDNARAYREIAKQKTEVEHKHHELVDTQQQLVQAEKMISLGALTAGVAHEINNPTNFVHVSAQNLDIDLRQFQTFLFDLAGEEAEQEVLDSLKEQFKPLLEHLATIKDGTERITTIVRDLRTFSQLDSADHKSVSVTEGLLSTINLVQTKNKAIANIVTEFKSHPTIQCHPAQLNQVFMNLIVNACDAIREKSREHNLDKPGLVTVGCSTEDESIQITIKDNGNGMTEETKAKLFEPFYTTKNIGEGTGLGLSISYGIVQKHNGELSVSSQRGVGTEFTLTLPM